MGKIIKYISIFFTLTSSSHAQFPTDPEAFSRFLFKGGYQYNHEEIKSVLSHGTWTTDQKAILEVQMLASMENNGRLEEAIQAASNYISTGNVEWAVNFLTMQRGFLRMLNSQFEEGNKDLETALDSGFLNNIDNVNDILLDGIRYRNKNLSSYLNDAARQSIGYYYLDRLETGSNPHKAYENFIEIKSKKIREESINQISYRLGDAYPEFTESIKNIKPKKFDDPNPQKMPNNTLKNLTNNHNAKGKKSSEEKFQPVFSIEMLLCALAFMSFGWILRGLVVSRKAVT